MSQTKGQKNPHHISSLWPHPLTVFGLDQKQTFRWIVLGRILPLSHSVLLGRLTRSRGTGRSSLSSSLGARPLACGSSCASAWTRGWGSTPGRWCTGRAKRRCGYAGVWSWRSSPESAGGTACTQTASHLWRTNTKHFKLPIMWKWQKQLCWLKTAWNGNHSSFYFHNVMDNVKIYSRVNIVN